MYININLFQSIHVLEKDYLTRSCHCRIRDVACLEWYEQST